MLDLGVLVLGAPESASNGQTSTQMPQYMQSEKSMSKRSRSLTERGLPPSRRGGRQVLVALDVDAPVGALAGAQHARRAVLLLERDDAARPGGGLFLLVRVLHGDRAAAVGLSVFIARRT